MIFQRSLESADRLGCQLAITMTWGELKIFRPPLYLPDWTRPFLTDSMLLYETRPSAVRGKSKITIFGVHVSLMIWKAMSLASPPVKY